MSESPNQPKQREEIPPTFIDGISAADVRAAKANVSAKDLDGDDAATREIPALKEEWRARAADVARSISGGDPIDVIEVPVNAAPTEYVAPPPPTARSAATVYELPVDDSIVHSVRDAIDAARGAQPQWRNVRFEQRVPYIDALREEMVEKRGDYVPSLATLSGRPMVEMLSGEYLPVVEHLRALPQALPALLVEKNPEVSNPLYPDVTLKLVPQPYGVVVVAVSTGPTFGQCMMLAIDAIVTGNAVIVVCDEQQPRIAEIMERIFERARLPRGLVRILPGGPKVMQALIERRPDKFFFRGFPEIGGVIARACTERHVEFSLGINGKDVLAVLESADVREAARAAVWAAFAGGGFMGGSSERIVVHARVFDEFRMHFIEAARTMNSHHAQLADIRGVLDDVRVKELLTDAIANGARVTYPAGEHPGKWILWRPAIVEGVSANARLSREQVQAPICALYRAEDVPYEVRRLLTMAPATSLNVIGTPRKAEWEELQALNVSALTLNEPAIGPGAWMGGGPAATTVSGYCGPQNMLRIKQVVENDYGEIGRVGFFPYTDDKAHALMDAMPAFYDVRPFLRARQRLNLIFRPAVRKLIERGE